MGVGECPPRLLGHFRQMQGFGNLMLAGFGGSVSSSVRTHSLFPSVGVPGRLLWGGSAPGTGETVVNKAAIPALRKLCSSVGDNR